MNVSNTCIYSYYDTLINIWSQWNDSILAGKFDDSSTTLTEALGLETSDGRSRAKEMYRIGLLRIQLTKGDTALNFIREGKNLQSNLGFLTAFICRAYNKKEDNVLLKALAALCSFSTIIQSVSINDLSLSINTIIYRLNEKFPCNKRINQILWNRYLLAAFFCELTVNDKENLKRIEDFLIGKNNDICLRIIDNGKSVTNRTVQNIRAEFRNVEDITNAIDSKISLGHIFKEKTSLFIVGKEDEIPPRGFYSLSRTYFSNFLTKCAKFEMKRLPNTPFMNFYKEDEKSRKGYVLEDIGSILKTDEELYNEYLNLMKTIKEGALRALNLFDDTKVNVNKKTLQKIYFGAPGTGKSYNLKIEVGTKSEIGEIDPAEREKIREDNNIRVTFHPDTDYASFVGCYKPMRSKTNAERIIYQYQPQAFVKAYIEAWKRFLKGTEDSNFYLIIEEINRGNCAQIFGDMFQLLDREDSGYSSYKVSPDSDLQMYLEEAFKDVDFSSEKDGKKLQEGTRMQLPPNLSILATMNTSDQSLFPMDSAFKRRWDWDYVKIDTSKVKDLYFKVGDSLYSWADFVNSINKYIQDNNGSTAKQIGPWFAKADDDEVDGKPTTISYDKFCSKVLFYLFNDALRDCNSFENLFKTKDDEDSETFFFENLFEKKDKGVANVENFLEVLPSQSKIMITKKSIKVQTDTTEEVQDDKTK